MGDGGGLVVADDGGQGGDQHQGPVDVGAEMVAACRKLLMITGRMALSSKLPCEPANAMAPSSDRTWMQTMTMASHWVGLTLPGMIEDPGSLEGRISSPIPHRGPDASQR